MPPSRLKGRPSTALTCQHRGHHGGEHQEEHAEEEAIGVVERLRGLVPDAEIQQADEDADAQVRDETQLRECLPENAAVITTVALP